MPTTTDVLVVGAGPAGLATAITALRHGARVLVVERRAGTSTVPRATGVSTRTMELFRFWGVDRAVRAAGVDCDPRVAVTHTLSAEPDELVSFTYPSMREALAVSPAYPALCSQDHIEPILADEIRRLGGEIRFGTELTALRTTPGGVRAELGPSGLVRARFVVGADGPRSAVRTALGIGWERLGSLGEWVNALFRPDLAALLGRRLPGITFVKHPDAECVLVPVGAGRWTATRRRGQGLGESAADYTPARWTELLRTATGIPELRPEILATDAFTMAADVAATFRLGPAFLVGDAAHRMTPMGGIGMNTAIHDGHELGWRLAWAVRGLAGDVLLDSYAAEREPLGRALAARSLREEREPDDGLPTDLGRSYRSPVVADDGAAPARGHSRTARPGERALHVWVRWRGRRASVLDLFEDRLTVLTGHGGAGWRRAAARTPGVPLEVLVAGRDLPDPSGSLCAAYRLGPDSAVLVRPDGIVAWRHDGPCADHGVTLAGAVETALGRPAIAASRMQVA
ncbi:FAD-dependent oxidoreductase [Pseudonocardia sp. DSM 110487]|uniref:FAD-dependent oxidoreductase n=1 Tax=Pseudonocardia sp. DSM 110487 TaxID=2865833 RepID=UPI001C6A5B1E|nr:FAD-dependent oxidoreductase [Pseudonocardia sp. DSM 110487]QYN32328.1 FAD-dependent oxidoreductase [Pseudonocardia sp. DSM 110487]